MKRTFDLSKVLVLSNVKIKNQTNGMEMTTLVAKSEADLKTGKISVTSNWERFARKISRRICRNHSSNGVLKFNFRNIS
jgi:transcription elongation factor GreA